MRRQRRRVFVPGRRPRLSPATVACAMGAARMGLAATRLLRPDPAAPPVEVRVVIPARDEEESIARCVASVLPQATEVVVVDDASSDTTATAAAAAGATVLRLEGDPPPGWAGKCRACWAGAQGATTEWLAFVDADVVLHPQALPTMAAATRHTSTSIVGGLVCRSFGERLLLPELGLALVQAGLPAGFASGHCFLVRRDHYLAVGGHSHPAVRGSMVEDRDLARALTGHDPRIAPALLQARMYPGVGALRRGLARNQAGLHSPAAHLAGLLLPVATRRPWAAMVVSAGGRAVAGQNPVYGLLAPLARAGLAALYLESWWRARTGRTVLWKDRPVVPAGRRRPSPGRSPVEATSRFTGASTPSARPPGR